MSTLPSVIEFKAVSKGLPHNFVDWTCLCMYGISFLPRLVSLDQSNCSKFRSIQILENMLYGKTFAENQFNAVTRLHSSRMHTARLLTVSPSMHCVGGVPALGGCLLLGVVSQHALRQPPPRTEFLTHTTENIILPQISFAGARKRSCRKIMFIHLSVILFTRGWGLCQGETPHTVKSGRYASYWNAFLLWKMLQ